MLNCIPLYLWTLWIQFNQHTYKSYKFYFNDYSGHLGKINWMGNVDVEKADRTILESLEETICKTWQLIDRKRNEYTMVLVYGLSTWSVKYRKRYRFGYGEGYKFSIKVVLFFFFFELGLVYCGASEILRWVYGSGVQKKTQLQYKSRSHRH